MKILRALFARGASAFFFDDQRAIKKGAEHDGFAYRGDPVTPGFRTIRAPGECISVLLVLEDGRIAEGDCAAIQYSGAGGRDPLFRADEFLPLLERHLRPRLEGRTLGTFRGMAAEFDAIEIGGRRLHAAIRYGLSQALLHARALEGRKLMCEVLCEEYGLPVVAQRIPVFGQSGDNRYENADKMILKGADALPHGLINNVEEKLGRDGEKLREYVRWLAKRIRRLRPDPAYRPALHIDVYGTVGIAFGLEPGRIAAYLASLAEDAGEFPLYIEGPVDAEEKRRQLEALRGIREELRRRGSPVKIVADEWCNTAADVREFADAGACDMIQIKTPVLGGLENTVESVLACKSRGLEAYQGGTCNETDVSARACVHAALAARPDRMLAKPGMGFDEGFMIVSNEMSRALEILKDRRREEAR